MSVPPAEASRVSAEPSPGGSRAIDAAISALLALALGALWGGCFQIEPRPVLALFALAPLLLLVLRPSRGPLDRWSPRGKLASFGLGWLHGIGAWLVAVPWIAGVLEQHGGLAGWLSVLLLLALCAYLGVYHAVFALVARRVVAGGRPAAAVLVLPAAWVALEWVRSVLLTGFPWNLAAYAWVAVPGALPASAWIGSFGVSFLVMTTQVAWFLALRRRSPRPLLALVPVAGLLGLGVLTTPPAGSRGSEPEGAPRGGWVQVVQPDIRIEDSGPASLARVAELSRCNELGGLVVWPESATFPRSWPSDAGLRAAVLELAEEGCAVLFNSTRWVGDDAFNAAFLVDSEGAEAHYDKVHLVPFGEYVPLAGLFPFLDEIARNAGGYASADTLVTLPWADQQVGVAICFEITLPSQVARLTARGATVLATLTNDAWYGDSSAPRQHFVAARFRAAENRRTLVRAAITGISAVVDPWGRPLELLEVGERGVIERRIAARRDRTLYSRAPWAVPLLCGLIAVLGLARAAGRSGG